jgi:hypothetical protein
MHHMWIRGIVAVFTCAALAGVAGCEAPGEIDSTVAAATPEQAVGQLDLALISLTGGDYRLRNAVFDIDRAGIPIVTLDSESDPNALSLDVELPEGNYGSSLRPGWALERLTGGGSVELVEGALVSANPTPFSISSGQTTQLIYRFVADGGLVVFGAGDLAVSIDVVPGELLPECSLFNPASCPAGLTCLLSDDAQRTYCANPGNIPVGGACNSEQCVAGSQCLHLDPENPTAGVCQSFCDVAAPPEGCSCQSIRPGSSVGVCTTPEPCDSTTGECGFCRPIGFTSCPSGATEWCSAEPISPSSDAQAQQACEACYGAPCFLESADCAGLGYGPQPPAQFTCGDAYFGFESGCSGDDGRIWAICNSFETIGYWGKDAPVAAFAAPEAARGSSTTTP